MCILFLDIKEIWKKNDEIYDKLDKFDEEFIKIFPSFLNNDKQKNELKAEVENIKNFMNKLYLY